MSFDSIREQWRAEMAERLQQMANRIELTLAWHDLDALLVDSVSIAQRPSGVWRARNNPASRGVERRIRLTARNALTVASQLAHDRGSPMAVFSSENVKDAKRIVRNAIVAYGTGAQA